MKCKFLYLIFFFCFSTFTFSYEQETIDWGKKQFILYKINNHTFYLGRQLLDRTFHSTLPYFESSYNKGCPRIEAELNELLSEQKNYENCLTEFSESCDKFLEYLYELSVERLSHKVTWLPAHLLPTYAIKYVWDFDWKFLDKPFNESDVVQLKNYVLFHSRLISELNKPITLNNIHYDDTPFTLENYLERKYTFIQSESYFSEIPRDDRKPLLSSYINLFASRLIDKYPTLFEKRAFSQPQEHLRGRPRPDNVGMYYHSMILDSGDMNCDIYNGKLAYNFATTIDVTVSPTLPDRADFSYLKNLQKHILKKYDDFNKMYADNVNENDKQKILAAYTAATVGVYTKNLSKIEKEDLLIPVYKYLFNPTGIPFRYDFTPSLYQRMNEQKLKHMMYFRYMYLGNED